jgi:hypothetical protein
VHSPWVYQTVNPENGPIYQFEVDIPMLVNDPGSYYVIAVGQLMDSDTTSLPALYRIDMANALEGEQRLISDQAPAEILEVSRSVRIVSYVAIGSVASIILYLLKETIKYRKHQILELTKGNFLIVYLMAGLVATLSTFLVEPHNDMYCQSGPFIVMICLQLFFAITVGRLWRINAVISPLLIQSMGQKETWTRKFMKTLQCVDLCSDSCITTSS